MYFRRNKQNKSIRLKIYISSFIHVSFYSPCLKLVRIMIRQRLETWCIRKHTHVVSENTQYQLQYQYTLNFADLNSFFIKKSAFLCNNSTFTKAILIFQFYFQFFKKEKQGSNFFTLLYKKSDITGYRKPGTQFTLIVKHALIRLGGAIWIYLYGLLHCDTYKIKPRYLIMLYFLVVSLHINIC